MSYYTSSQKYSYEEYRSNGLPAPRRSSLVNRSPFDSAPSFFSWSDPAQVELARSTIPLKLNLRSAPCGRIPPVLASESSGCLHALLTLLVWSDPAFLDPSGPMLIDPSAFVDAFTFQALLSFVAVSALAPLDPSVPPYRRRLRLLLEPREKIEWQKKDIKISQ